MLLTPHAEAVEDLLSTPELVLLLGREGCVQCSDLATVADRWSDEVGQPCALILLEEAAGARLRSLLPMVAHVDMLPAVVPLRHGAPVDVLHGQGRDVLDRAMARFAEG